MRPPIRRRPDPRQARALLQACGLPVADLADQDLEQFLYLAEGDRLLALAGLQVEGRCGLLRSVAVAPDRRGLGLAGELVRAAENRAAELGVDELWLLTDTADGFFQRLGYGLRQRREAADFIRRSREFAELCPDDARLMSRRLGRRT